MAAGAPFLVRGALVIDGSGAPGFRGDLRVGPDGRITAVGVRLSSFEGEAVVEGEGLALSAGFVDLHSHSDLYTLVRSGKAAPVGDGPKLLQGCTAQVFGQDGISAAPLGSLEPSELAAALAGLDGSIGLSQWTWRSFGSYLAALRGSASTRVAALVGHSTVRRAAMGVAARPPSDSELSTMCAMVDQAMAEGALGLSSGLVYVPAAFAATSELVALCQVVARRGGRFFVHVRSESDGVVEATEEVLEVARRSGVHLHYSHIKTAGRANWPSITKILELVEEYRAAGVTVTADVHPYTAGSSTASVLLPPWMLEGGQSEALSRLADPGARARARNQLLNDTRSWDNWLAFSGGWEGLRVAGARQPGLAGRSFASVISSAGITDPTSAEAFDLVFDLLGAEELGMSLISFNNLEENVARFLSQPYTSVGSDALVNPDGHPHPRLYGTFPRVLGRYVRQQGILDLAGAVGAMTTRAAAAAGWQGPGSLAAGSPADLVLFDPEAIIDLATYEEPRLAPAGIEAVWVGGRCVVEGGQLSLEVPVAEDGAGSFSESG